MLERHHAPRWLLAGILLAVIANLWTAFGTISEAPNYASLDMPFPPALRLILSGAWALLLTVLLFGLLRHRRMAFIWTAPLLSLYGLASQGFEILFARSDYSRGRFAFQLLVTILLLIPVWWVALRKGWLKRPVSSETRA